MVRATQNANPSGKVLTFQADFSTASDQRGGRRSAHVPPGDYLLEVADAEVVPVKSDPTGRKLQVRWIFRILKGEAGIGQVVYLYTSLDETKNGGLFELRNVLSDLLDGKEIPKSKANVNLANYLGKPVGAMLTDDEPWNRENDDGTITTIEKSVISLTYPASKYVGFTPPKAATAAPAPAVAPAAAPAATPLQNGAAADPVAVAAAIAAPSQEDADIEPLPVADL